MSMGKAPEAVQMEAMQTERIRRAEQEEREHTNWWLPDSSVKSGVRLIRGSDLQAHIDRTREDYLILKEGDKAGEERLASEFGFIVPEPIMRGVDVVVPVQTTVMEDIVEDKKTSKKDKRSPAEKALELLPDQDLYDLAVKNKIDLPADAFDRTFTIKALLKAGIVT